MISTVVRTPGSTTGQADAILTAGAEPVPAVRIRDLSMHFLRKGGGDVAAIDGISLDIAPGEMISVVGPSGCGKTTLLRSVAGLNQPDGGSLELAGKTVYSSGRRVWVPPEKRGLGMMFQNYALWPHMTVFENVAYPLRMMHVPKKERTERVLDALKFANVSDLIHEQPGRLSGGQQQRVALARSIVGRPSVVLFDEPLSNVDAKVRDELRVELRRMQSALGFAALYVTHDQEEALQMGDRIVVLERGRIAQLGAPEDVYRQPASRYVAEFMGSGNVFSGPVSRTAVRASVATPVGDLDCSELKTTATSTTAIVRPTDIEVGDERSGGVVGVVETRMFLGVNVQLVVAVGDGIVKVLIRGGGAPEVGDRIALRVKDFTIVDDGEHDEAAGAEAGRVAP